MTFGGQSVTLRSFTLGTRDRLNKPAPVPHDTVWAGVLMRPFRGSDDVKLTEIARRIVLAPLNVTITFAVPTDGSKR